MLDAIKKMGNIGVNQNNAMLELRILDYVLNGFKTKYIKHSRKDLDTLIKEGHLDKIYMDCFKKKREFSGSKHFSIMLRKYSKLLYNFKINITEVAIKNNVLFFY
jgi:hypothetical protein